MNGGRRGGDIRTSEPTTGPLHSVHSGGSPSLLGIGARSTPGLARFTKRNDLKDHHGGQQPLLLTVPLSMTLLSIGRTTLYKLMHHGDVTVVKVGGATRILRSSVEDYISRNAICASPGGTR